MHVVYTLIALFFLNLSSNEVTHEYIIFDVQSEIDSSTASFIEPYKSILDAQMNEALIYNEQILRKGKPESLLGNWTADICLEIAQKATPVLIDLSVFNNGGLRISSLQVGDITKRDIYQLMPFENELVIVKLNTEEFQELIDYINTTGGQPISISSTYNNEDSIYNVLTTDYLANGGDKMSFLKNKKQNKVGIKMRDAMLSFCNDNDTIRAIFDNRHLKLINDN
jgi:2',3'-cyclic-nucleotide 2'-phosphodiesterase (5'-nucleotidase family)